MYNCNGRVLAPTVLNLTGNLRIGCGKCIMHCIYINNSNYKTQSVEGYNVTYVIIYVYIAVTLNDFH